MGKARDMVLSVVALILFTLVPASCDSSGEVSGEPDPASAIDEGVAKEQSALHLRWRMRRPRGGALPTPGDAAVGGAGSGGVVGTGGSGGAGAGSGGTTGTGGDSGSFVNGGRCPNNAPMPAGQLCGPYGLNCTYDAADGTHYCTCLASGGWTCR